VPVGTALIVAGSFEPESSLEGVCNDFMAQNQLPLALLRVETLLRLVNSLRADPNLRTKLRWRQLFYRAGVIPTKVVQEELHAARSEAYSRELRTETEGGNLS